MRGKIARDTLKKTRTSKNTAATTIQKTIRGKIARNKIETTDIPVNNFI